MAAKSNRVRGPNCNKAPGWVGVNHRKIPRPMGNIDRTKAKSRGTDSDEPSRSLVLGSGIASKKGEYS